MTLKEYIIKEAKADPDVKPADVKKEREVFDKRYRDMIHNFLKEYLADEDYETYVTKLMGMMNDEKLRKVVEMVGGGEFKNDTFSVKKDVKISASELQPTQSEIDIDKSLKYGLENGDIKHFWDDGATINDQPILTLNSEYIIDGHHRWSQMYIFNPNAVLNCIDLQSKLGPVETLKCAQLAIAAKKGEIIVNKVEGQSLIGMESEKIIDYVNDHISDVCVDEMNDIIKSDDMRNDNMIKCSEEGMKARKDAEKNDKDIDVKDIDTDNLKIDKEGIAEYLAMNCKQMNEKNVPIKGASLRKYMPQSDSETPETMDKGSIDLNDEQ